MSNGGAELVAGEAQQVQDLRLHGHVQGGGRLVGQDEPGVEHERHRDDDALLLAAGELVRIVVDAGGRVGDADLLQDLDGLGPAFLPVLHAVGEQPLLDLPSDRVDGVEHRVRLLEDHRRLAATHAAQVVAAEAEHVHRALPVAAAQPHRPGGGGGLGQQLDDRAGGHRFAGAGFADHADDGPVGNREVDAVDGLDRAGVGDEGDGQVVDDGEVVARRRRQGAVLHGRPGQILVLRAVCPGHLRPPFLRRRPSCCHPRRPARPSRRVRRGPGWRRRA